MLAELTLPDLVMFMFYNEKHTLNPEHAWSDKDHNSDLITWPPKHEPDSLWPAKNATRKNSLV